MRTPDWLICIPSFHIIENCNSNCYSQYNENHCNVEIPLIRMEGLGYLVVVIGKLSASLSVDDVLKILNFDFLMSIDSILLSLPFSMSAIESSGIVNNTENVIIIINFVIIFVLL